MSQGIKFNCYINGIQITTKHPVYRLRWTLMTRCYSASKEDFPYYQGKGIKICDSWKTNQEVFFKWCLDNGWQKGLVLDRKDPQGNYDPDNCQFITKEDNLKKSHIDSPRQMQHLRNAKLSLEDVSMIRQMTKIGVPCAKLARDYNVSRATIIRIKYYKTWKV